MNELSTANDLKTFERNWICWKTHDIGYLKYTTSDKNKVDKKYIKNIIIIITFSPALCYYVVDVSPISLCTTFSTSNLWEGALRTTDREHYCQLSWKLGLFVSWYGTEYSRMDQVKFVEDSLSKIWRDMVCLSRPYPLSFPEGCLPQILLGSFLNTWTHMTVIWEILITVFTFNFVRVFQRLYQLLRHE